MASCAGALVFQLAFYVLHNVSRVFPGRVVLVDLVVLFGGVRMEDLCLVVVDLVVPRGSERERTREVFVVFKIRSVKIS